MLMMQCCYILTDDCICMMNGVAKFVLIIQFPSLSRGDDPFLLYLAYDHVCVCVCARVN
jgi:hypothetical protein